MKDDLTARTLHLLNEGMTGRVIDKALADVTADCFSRPTLNVKRKVTITLEVKPVEIEGTLRSLDIDTRVDTKVPAQALPQTMLPVAPDIDQSGAHVVRAKLPDSVAYPMFDVDITPGVSQKPESDPPESDVSESDVSDERLN